MTFGLLRALVLTPIPILFRSIVDQHVADSNVVGVLSTSAIFLGLIFLNFTFMTLGTRHLAAATISIGAELRARVFEKMQFLSFGYLDNQKTGRLLSKYTHDTQQVGGMIQQTANGILPSVLHGVLMLLVMVVMNWQLTFVILLMLPVFAFIRYYFFKKLIEHNQRERKVRERLMGTATELISATRLIRSLGEETQATTQMNQSSYEMAHSRYKIIQFNTAFHTFTYSVTEFLSLLVIGTGALLVIGGSLSLGTLIAFMVALPVILSPINIFSQISEQYFSAREAYNSLNELLDSPYVEEWNGDIQLTPFKGDIEFQNIGFSYARQKIPAIQDFSLHIQPGEHIALVGPSGSGKSTIANLVLGLYKPKEGQILFDGIPQEKLYMRGIRRQAAIVMQENLLLSGTIIDNIRFARPSATDEDIYEAAKMANADIFIDELPQGYMTIIGERGVTLSGGQRQRISIARAILRNPTLLILDEATSALDYQSEHYIQEALDRLAHGRTVITIAHRLSTILNANRIVVLNKGQIMETGTFDELRKRGQYFAKMLDSHEFTDLGTETANQESPS